MLFLFSLQLKHQYFLEWLYNILCKHKYGKGGGHLMDARGLFLLR